MNATYYPAVAGSASLLLRLAGAVLGLAGLGLLFIGLVFAVT